MHCDRVLAKDTYDTIKKTCQDECENSLMVLVHVLELPEFQFRGYFWKFKFWWFSSIYLRESWTWFSSLRHCSGSRLPGHVWFEWYSLCNSRPLSTENKLLRCSEPAASWGLHISPNQSWQTFSVKGDTVDIFGFAGHTIPVTTTQFCHYRLKAARHNV